MSAHWDDGTNIQGTVTFSKQNASGPDTVVVTQTLSNGRANLSEALGATTSYDVMLVDTVDTELIKFPMATAIINPGNLKQAQIKFVFREADNSLKSGNLSVSMEFWAAFRTVGATLASSNRRSIDSPLPISRSKGGLAPR
jgi:hypothetical protein